MARSPMSRKWNWWIVAGERTPDGFFEVTLENKGRILATTVVRPDSGLPEEWWATEILRRS